MNRRDFNSLARQLAPSLPGLYVRGSMMFVRPVRHILRGIFFEGSNFDERSFNVWTFFLLLCIPTKRIGFTCGRRIRHEGGDSWSADTANLKEDLSAALERQAVPLLANVQTPRDLIRAARSLSDAGNVQTQQLVAYSLALAGDAAKASDARDRLVANLNVAIPAQKDMRDRARVLRNTLAEGPLKVLLQLETWETETVRNLGLAMFQ